MDELEAIVRSLKDEEEKDGVTAKLKRKKSKDE